MGKRAQREHGHDSTMEVSASQYVGPKPPTAPRLPPGAKNDASMWAYRVVGTDDFVPSPKKRQSKRGRWIAAGVLGVAAAAGGTYAWVSSGGDDAPAEAAAAAPAPDKPAPPAPPAKPAVAAPANPKPAPPKVAAAQPAKPAADAPDAITAADPKAKPKKAVKRTATATKKKPAPKKR